MYSLNTMLNVKGETDDKNEDHLEKRIDNLFSENIELKHNGNSDNIGETIEDENVDGTEEVDTNNNGAELKLSKIHPLSLKNIVKESNNTIEKLNIVQMIDRIRKRQKCFNND